MLRVKVFRFIMIIGLALILLGVASLVIDAGSTKQEAVVTTDLEDVQIEEVTAEDITGIQTIDPETIPFSYTYNGVEGGMWVSSLTDYSAEMTADSERLYVKVNTPQLQYNTELVGSYTDEDNVITLTNDSDGKVYVMPYTYTDGKDIEIPEIDGVEASGGESDGLYISETASDIITVDLSSVINENVSGDKECVLYRLEFMSSYPSAVYLVDDILENGREEFVENQGLTNDNEFNQIEMNLSYFPRFIDSYTLAEIVTNVTGELPKYDYMSRFIDYSEEADLYLSSKVDMTFAQDLTNDMTEGLFDVYTVLDFYQYCGREGIDINLFSIPKEE